MWQVSTRPTATLLSACKVGMGLIRLQPHQYLQIWQVGTGPTASQSLSLTFYHFVVTLFCLSCHCHFGISPHYKRLFYFILIQDIFVITIYYILNYHSNLVYVVGFFRSRVARARSWVSVGYSLGLGWCGVWTGSGRIKMGEMAGEGRYQRYRTGRLPAQDLQHMSSGTTEQRTSTGSASRAWPT